MIPRSGIIFHLPSSLFPFYFSKPWRPPWFGGCRSEKNKRNFESAKAVWLGLIRERGHASVNQLDKDEDVARRCQSCLGEPPRRPEQVLLRVAWHCVVLTIAPCFTIGIQVL